MAEGEGRGERGGEEGGEEREEREEREPLWGLRSAVCEEEEREKEDEEDEEEEGEEESASEERSSSCFGDDARIGRGLLCFSDVRGDRVTMLSPMDDPGRLRTDSYFVIPEALFFSEMDRRDEILRCFFHLCSFPDDMNVAMTSSLRSGREK